MFLRPMTKWLKRGKRKQSKTKQKTKVPNAKGKYQFAQISDFTAFEIEKFPQLGWMPKEAVRLDETLWAQLSRWRKN